MTLSIRRVPAWAANPLKNVLKRRKKMKTMPKKWVVSLAAAAMLLATATAAFADAPKYVFFFLGDGMASAQIQSTEAYLATKYAVDNYLMDVSTYPANPAKPTAPRGDLNAE
jgi:alkaline phosphatase